MPVFLRSSEALPFNSFRDEYIERVLAGRGDTLIYLVPNRVAKNRLEREALVAAGDRAIPASGAYTVEDIASRLFAVAFPDTRQLSDAECAVFIEDAVRDLLRRGELSYFERPRGAAEADSIAPFPLQRGTFELIVNTVHRLSETGVTVSDLQHDISDLTRRSPAATELRRAKDIASIYESYLLRLGDEFVDRPLQVVRLLERYNSNGVLPQDFRIAFPNAEYVLMDGFDVLESPVVSFIASISQIPNLCTAISTRSGSNEEVYKAVHRLEEELRSVGFNPVSEHRENTSTLRAHLEESLFRVEECGQIAASDANISTFADPSTEVQMIARRIKQLYSEDASLRADLSSVVVASPNPEIYTPLFREVFAQFGIPAFVADRHQLDRAPLMRGLFALLDLARYGPRRTTIGQVLSSAYFRFIHGDSRFLDSENLRSVLARHHLSGDFQQVLQRLQKIIRELEGEQRSSNTGDRDRARDIEQCQRAHIDLILLETVIAPIANPLRPRDFQAALTDVLGKLGIHGNLLVSSDKTLSTHILEVDVRAYRAFIALMEDLVTLFAHLGLEERALPVSFYQERLRAASAWTRYNPKPIPRAVQVLSLEQSVDQPAEYLFVAGLQEENLPRPYRPQIFLSESRQPKEAKQLEEERLAFFRAIVNFSKSLFLSSCERSNSGRPLLPSPFLSELQRRVTLTPSESPNTMKAVFSYADLYREYARRSDSDVATEALLAGARKESRQGFYRPVLESRVPYVRDIERRRATTMRSTYTGYLTMADLTTEERDTLERNSTDVWSVSQLELYARCPFQYFLRRVLRLEPLDEETDGLEASARGVLLHEVLRRFMTKRRDDDRPIRHYPDDAAQGEESILELRGIARECLEEFDVEHPFWKLDAETLIGAGEAEGDLLQRFLDKENELVDSELRPQFFEVAFGLQDAADSDSAIVLREEVTIDGLKLRGKIDRIDASDRYFAIVDYKTGASVSKLKDIKRGISFQLPLYLRVAEDVLRSHFPHLTNVASVAGIYHKLCDPTSRREVAIAVKEYAKEMYPDIRRQGMLDSEAELRQLIGLVVERAKTYVEGIARGAFPLVEEDLENTVCRYCDFQAVCRVSDAAKNAVLRPASPLRMESSNNEDVLIA